jgi:EmrB/QacA subfamily drug resistance transporter
VLTDERRAGTSREPLAPGAVLSLCVAILAMTAFPLAATGTNLAFPEIREDFGSSLASLSWVLSAYSIVTAGLTLLGGAISDRIGWRLAFTVGLAIFTAASVLCALSTGTAMLIGARIIQAIGGALAIPASLQFATNGWPATRRLFAIGVWTAAFPIGSTFAPVLSAVVLEIGSWRWVFITPAVIGAVALLLLPLIKSTGDTRSSTAREFPDVAGMLVGTVAVTLAALGLVQGRSWGWTSPRTILVLGGSIALATLFIRLCRQHEHPMLPIHLFKLKTFAVANVANLFVSMVGMAMWLVWPLHWGGVWGWSSIQVGLGMTPTPFLGGSLAVWSGRWTQRHGFRGMLLIGGCLLVAGQIWLMTHASAVPNYWTGQFPGLVLIGSGMGMLFAPLNAAALLEIDRTEYATGSATFSTGRYLAGAMGIAAVIAVFGDGIDADNMDPLRQAYALLTALAAIGLVILAIWWPRRVRTALT